MTETITTSLKRLVRKKITDGPHESPVLVDDGIPFVSAEAVVDGKIDFTKRRGNITRKAHEEYCKKAKPQYGDLFFVKSGSTTGKIAIVDTREEFNIWSPLALIRTNELINNKLLYYILQSPSFQLQVQQYWSFGTQPNIGMNKIEQLQVTFPKSKKLQSEIVSYLDIATEKYFSFIQSKQHFIALLKEQRQSIITHAVTKGIDENVQMKETGIVWLGDVPAHWEVRRLKNCIKGKLRYGANESGELYNPSWYRYIRITDFNSEGKLDEQNKLSLLPEVGKEYELKDGDILFARSGATVGKTFQFRADSPNEKYCYAGYLIRAEADESVMLSDFLYEYTNSKAFENWKNSIFSKATIENISADKYCVLRVPVPTVKEQQTIINYIRTETKTLDIAIGKAEKEIELMKEYREAMIAEAVTGKMKL